MFGGRGRRIRWECFAHKKPILLVAAAGRMGYRLQMKKGRLPVAGWRPFVVRAAVLGEISPDIRKNIR